MGRGSIWDDVEPLLERVQKPARYIGLEDGAAQPDHGPEKVAWLLTYPDAYEVGLPNAGLQILAEILNERDAAAAERSYAPWLDLEAEMRAGGVPLFSIETTRPAGDFDILAFNLAAELTYTNVLSCIDLTGMPVRTAERADDGPLVLVGGHCAFNPGPLALHVDAAVLGDGEEVVGEITDVVGAWKRAGRPGGRRGAHRALAGVPGVYVPSLYRVESDGRVVPDDPAAPAVVEKRTITDLAAWPYPKRQLVPLTEVVHDRLNVEVFRGCTRGCRFCQAGIITRPVRERPAAQVSQMVTDGLARTGHDEVTLTSLSTADYSGIEDVVGAITCNDAAVSLLVEGGTFSPADLAGLPEELSAVLPLGVDIVAAAPVPPGDGSLQQAVTSSEWEVALAGADPLELSTGADQALAASTLPNTVARKGVQVEVDLRPALLSLAVLLPVAIGDAARLHLELASAAGTGGRTVRPSEAVSALWPHLGSGRVRRVAQWIERDGVRREPLPLPPTTALAQHALSSRAPLSRSPHAGTDRTLRGGRGHPVRLHPAEPAQAAGS